jgi:hypothetical protein
MLQPFGPGIWIADGLTVSTGGFHDGTRMAVILIAPKRRFVEAPQSDLGCPVGLAKIFRLTRRANHFYSFGRLASIRGTLAIVTNVGRDAVDAAVSQDERP